MVELLSPIALPDAPASASYGFSAVGFTGLRRLQAPIDWGQSIYHTLAAAVSSLAIHSHRFLRFGPPEDLPGPLLLLGPLLNPFFGPLALPRVLCRSSEPIPPLGRPGPLCS